MPARIVSFPSIDGTKLEGRLASPFGARGIAVLCHAPEPAGGLMPNVLMPSLQRALEAAGWASLRFNYRGVGRSEGVFDAGTHACAADALGAVAYSRRSRPTVPCAVIGWSYGALIGLEACAGETAVEVYVGLSPPLALGDPMPVDESLGDAWSARSLLIAGSADAACDASAMGLLARSLGADVEILDGADHGFTGRLAELAAIVTWFLR